MDKDKQSIFDNIFGVGQTSTVGTVSPIGEGVTQWDTLIDKVSTEHPNVPKDLVRSVIAQESGGDPYATGVDTPYGKAKGLGQFVDSTAKDFIPGWTKPDDSYDPEKNVRGMFNYFSHLLAKNNGNRAEALKDYYGRGRHQTGPTTEEYAQQVLSRTGEGYTPAQSGNKSKNQIFADIFGYNPGITKWDEGEQESTVKTGNIDLKNRPIVKNDDGTISTVRSISFNEDGKEILIPTVSEDGKIMSDDEAIDAYHKTGKFLGKFNTVEESNAYAEQLHNDQSAMYDKQPKRPIGSTRSFDVDENARFLPKVEPAVQDITVTQTDPLIEEKYKSIAESEGPVAAGLKSAGGALVYADSPVQKYRQQEHPLASTVGTIAGSVAPMIAGGIGGIKTAMSVPKIAAIAKSGKAGQLAVRGITQASVAAYDYLARNNDKLLSDDPKVAANAKKDLAVNIAGGLVSPASAVFLPPNLVQPAAQAATDILVSAAGQSAFGDNAFSKENLPNTIISAVFNGVMGIGDVAGLKPGTLKIIDKIEEVGRNLVPEKPFVPAQVVESGVPVGRTLDQVNADFEATGKITSEIEQKQAEDITALNRELSRPTSQKQRRAVIEEGLNTPSKEELFLQKVKEKYGDTKPTKAQVVSDFGINRERAGWAIKNVYNVVEVTPETTKAAVAEAKNKERHLTDYQISNAKKQSDMVPGVRFDGEQLGYGKIPATISLTDTETGSTFYLPEGSTAKDIGKRVKELRLSFKTPVTPEPQKGVVKDVQPDMRQTEAEVKPADVPSVQTVPEPVVQQPVPATLQKKIGAEQYAEPERQGQGVIPIDEAQKPESAATGEETGTQVSEEPDWVTGDLREIIEKQLEVTTPDDIYRYDIPDDEPDLAHLRSVAAMSDNIENKKMEFDRSQKLYDAVKKDLFGELDAKSFAEATDQSFVMENKRMFAKAGGKKIDRARMDFIENNRGLLQELGINEADIENPSQFADLLRNVASSTNIRLLKNEITAGEKELASLDPNAPKQEPKAKELPVEEMKQQDLFGGEKSVAKLEAEARRKIQQSEIKNRIEQRKGGEADLSRLPMFEDQDIEGSQSTLKFGGEETPAEKIASMQPEQNPLTMGGLAAGQELPDKAINIRLDKMDASYDAKRAVLETAADFSGKIDEARRGVIKNEAIKELADNLGMSETKLLKRKRGQAFNAEEALAARNLLNASANRIVGVKNDLMAKRKAGTITDEDLINFRLEMSKHAAIQAEVSGLTAEAGRALNSFRIMSENKGKLDSAKDLLEKLGGSKNTEDILSKLDSFDDSNIWGMSRFIGKTLTETIPDKINRYFIESILSGPPTHVANFLSNTASNVYRMALEKPFTIATEKVLLGDKAKRNFGEIPAELVGMMRGFGPALDAAKETLKTGRQKISGPLDTKPSTSTSKIAMALPTRWLSASDEFFKTMIVSGDLQAQAYNKVKGMGLKGNDAINKTAELLANPSDEMMKHAWKEAEYRTFTGKPGELTKAISNIRKAIPLKAAHYVIPFLNTPMKILKYGLERAPLTAEARLVYKGLRGDLTKEQIPEEVGKIAFSHMLAVPLILATRSGVITGAGPQGRNERNTLYSTGWQPYSIKIGDTYYSYARLEPLSTILGFTADFATLPYEEIGEKGMKDIANRIGYAIGQNILNKTFFEQLSNVVKATEDPGRYGIKFINRMAGSLIPNIVGKAADVGDKNLRQGNKIIEIWQKKIPGASNLLYPKRDIWGRPVEKSPSGLYAFFSPIRTREVSDEKIDREIARLGVKIGEPSKLIGKSEMSVAAYDKYSVDAGTLARNRVNRYINSVGYSRDSDEDRKERIRALVTESRKRIRERIKITPESK